MPNDWTNQPMFCRCGDYEAENEPVCLYPGLLGGRVAVKQPGPPGQPVAEGENYTHKAYQFIKTDSTMTVAPYRGAVAWWANQAAYLVTTSPTALGRGRVAGLFQNAITPGYYGFIQIRGKATVKFVDVPTAEPTAAGGFVIPSATAGKADCLAAGAAATYPQLGRAAGVRNPASEAVVDLCVDDVL